MAHRVQKRLRVQFDVKEGNEEDAGLLRSILVAKDGDDDTLPPSPSSSVFSTRPDEFETEEMEVKVDPSIFLQCGLDRSVTPELSDFNSDSEENHSKNVLSEIVDGRNFDKNSPRTLNNDDEPEKSFNCSLCSKSFETQLNLQNHLWSHLPKAENFCDDLKQSDSQRFSNDSNGSFVCPICNKKISTKGNLKVHLETHRPKGKYGCDICGRIFKTQSNLFRHKEYHGGVQFPCSVCGRVYPTNSTLRAHSITHSDLRPHACPLCDKTFKRNQDLKFHINQHTGARPYSCTYCSRAFASSGNCFSHRKRMHPKEVQRDRERAADLMK